MKKRFRAYIIALTALFMASCAAFFSVTGVGKLASGAGMAAILLVTALEVGKLVVASFIHRRWNQINWFQRSFATFGVIVAMALTSIGIFGQLIGGYTATSAEFQTKSAEIALKHSEKESLKSEITRYKEQIDRKEKRASKLSDLLGQQENRVDSLITKGWSLSAREARQLVDRTNQDIVENNRSMDSLSNEITRVNKEISSVDSSIVIMNSTLATGEAAPLKMISDMLGVEMDTTTKAFFGFFVLIFDPFAIMLVIFFNVEMAAVRKEEEEEDKEEYLHMKNMNNLSSTKPITQDTFEKQVESQRSSNTTEEFVAVSPYEPTVIYQHDNEGDFQKVDTSEQLDKPSEILVGHDQKDEYKEHASSYINITSENKKLVYQALLGILYIGGQVKPRGMIYTFSDFMLAIEQAKLKIDKEDVVKFLEFCVESKILEVGKHKRTAIMSYQEALEKVNASF